MGSVSKIETLYELNAARKKHAKLSTFFFVGLIIVGLPSLNVKHFQIFNTHALQPKIKTTITTTAIRVKSTNEFDAYGNEKKTQFGTCH